MYSTRSANIKCSIGLGALPRGSIYTHTYLWMQSKLDAILLPLSRQVLENCNCILHACRYLFNTERNASKEKMFTKIFLKAGIQIL